MTIHWSVVNQTGATPLKESPSSRSYELPKTYQLKVGLHEPLPTPCWNTDRLDLVWVLCGSCVGNHSCCELTGTHENSQCTAGRGQRTATPGAQPQRDSTPSPQTQGTSWERRWEDCKSWGLGSTGTKQHFLGVAGSHRLVQFCVLACILSLTSTYVDLNSQYSIAIYLIICILNVI